MIDIKLFKTQIFRFLKDMLWLLPFVVIIYLAGKETKKLRKQYCETYWKEEFRGKILKKYVDTKNHNYHMLIIKRDQERDSLDYSGDHSGFWDFVEVNDSIIKKKESFKLIIIQKDTSFITDCPYDFKHN